LHEPPPHIRVSIGSAAILGLDLAFISEKPTTIYLQTFQNQRCIANCKFCAQARNADSKIDKIARALYPAYPLEKVIEKIGNAYRSGKVKRVCIQTMNYTGMFDDLISIIKSLKRNSDIPISASVHPLTKSQFRVLKNAEIKNIVIPLDACTEQLFDEIKGKKVQGPYSWKKHWNALKDATEIFGKNNVGTHLIVGLGETEREAALAIQKLLDIGVYCGLFAFTPIHGTPMEENPPPNIVSYRLIQLTRYLMSKGYIRFENMKFDENERITDLGIDRTIVVTIVNSGAPFETSGCENCNRPFATEAPKGEIYNYPRKLRRNEIRKVKFQLSARINLH
jgi:biotin synthase